MVGASVDSGSDEITPLIASAIAEHRQVNVGYLAQDAQPVDSFGAFADPADGRPAVIDGGSVDTSPALLAAAEDASQIIVVVKIGRDFTEAVQAGVMTCCPRRHSDFCRVHARRSTQNQRSGRRR